MLASRQASFSFLFLPSWFRNRRGSPATARWKLISALGLTFAFDFGLRNSTVNEGYRTWGDLECRTLETYRKPYIRCIKRFLEQP
jgi:hypothetical protein